MDRLLYDSKYDISGNSIEPAYEGNNVITAVFAPDNKFCKYFGVALQSLIENANSKYNYDIIVLDADIEQRNKRILLNMIPRNFTLRFFDIDRYIKNNFKNLKLYARLRWGINIYYRMFIPFIMKDYEKVLNLAAHKNRQGSLKTYPTLEQLKLHLWGGSQASVEKLPR